MKQQVVEIKGNIEWECFRGKGGNWLGVCHALGLTIQSETWVSLLDDMAQTLNAMFLDLLASQELTKFLRDRGWKSAAPIPLKPVNLWFDVPFVPKLVARDPQVALR